MRVPTLLPLVVLVAAAMAGCSSQPPEAAADTPEESFEDLQLTATATTGVVRGVVVDLGLRPLDGVNVTLAGQSSTTTDASGRFGFSDVQPGLVALSASKPGYSTIQATTEVVAGVDDPKAVTIALDRLPGSEPYVTTLVWHGFLACSWTAGGVFATGCLVGDNIQDRSRQFDPVDRAPDFLQSELIWQSTQTLGTNLCMRHYARDDAGFEMLMDDVCGQTPLLQQADRARLNETGVGTGRGIERVVWVAGYGAESGPGLAYNQQVDVYTHLFYNLVPDPAWRFVTDGPYQVPPA